MGNQLKKCHDKFTKRNPIKLSPGEFIDFKLINVLTNALLEVETFSNASPHFINIGTLSEDSKRQCIKISKFKPYLNCEKDVENLFLNDYNACVCIEKERQMFLEGTVYITINGTTTDIINYLNNKKSIPVTIKPIDLVKHEYGSKVVTILEDLKSYTVNSISGMYKSNNEMKADRPILKDIPVSKIIRRSDSIEDFQIIDERDGL
jgi:hypothetical protein